MAKASRCVEPRCKNVVLARGLCARHYGQRYRLGTLPATQGVLFRHELSEVDLEAETADCLACGRGVRIRVRKSMERGRERIATQCYAKYIEGRDAAARTPEGKARVAAYRQTPEYKAHRAALNEDPERKARQREYRRRWNYKRAGRADARTPEQRRAAHLRQKYKISLADYQRLYKAQEGKCSICKTAHDTLFVDHCHTSGAVRELLCNHCNTALGFLRDNPDAATSAAEYLKRHKSA